MRPAAPSPTICYHCAEPVPRDFHATVTIDGRPRPMCCIGCEAVARLIVDSGSADFYRHRSAPAPRPPAGLLADPPDSAAANTAATTALTRYDLEINQRGFVRTVTDPADANAAPSREARLLVDGVYCAACGWLIENHLARLPGVAEVHVNPTTRLARIRFDPARVALSTVMGRIAAIGYEPHPLLRGESARSAIRERRAALKRLAVAGLGMMQVMMFAIAMYLGAFTGMDADLRRFLRGVSLLVATPVVFYAARPFFAGAWRNLAAGAVGMDVPVALAIGAAYGASVWTTLFEGPAGEVYFDSVVMFTFFLSLGRYLEMAARHRTGAATEALARLAPETALRVGTAHGRCDESLVPTADLEPGDLVRVLPGETVPADGSVWRGESSTDESLITGESRPRRRVAGDALIGGSVNLTAALEMRVERTGDETVLSHIGRLLERAQSDRPRLARLADRIAGHFVLGLLVITTGVALWWWHAAPERAFSITLAVLVVTCPCALSLATPAALTAATGALARIGLLITRGQALERLAVADRIVFDKTGTLTRGRFQIAAVAVAPGQDADACLALAAALEAHSEHPLAAPFRRLAQGGRAQGVRNVPGAGLEGQVDGRRLRIGTREFVAGLAGAGEAGLPPLADDDVVTPVYLGDEDGWLARFALADSLRPGVGDDVLALTALGLSPAIASGDLPGAVSIAADGAGIEARAAQLKPDDKVAAIHRLQAGGHRVVMVGDGVNDAPVLAAADVSVAMGGGAALAHASADIVLMGATLAPLAVGVRHSRRTLSIIRQNLGWALGYNLVALPLAASGAIAPWMAAIGMSASSLVVVLNALRLSRVGAGGAWIPTPLAASGAAVEGTP